MFTKQAEKIADVLIEKEISNNEDKWVIVYGLSSGIEMMLNIITTLILARFFKLIPESLVFFASFVLIRTYAGGFHCKKAMTCYFMSSGIIALVLGIIKFTPEEYIFVLTAVLLVFSILTLFFLAPVETPNKPLDEAEKRHYRKKSIMLLTLETVAVAVLYAVGMGYYAFVVALGITMSAMLTVAGSVANRLGVLR